MKLLKLPDDTIRAQSNDTLEKVLLDRVLKLRKLNREMNENVHVQKAMDALATAKVPFKRAKAKWISEIESIEMELRGRDVKFNISWDDIFEGDDI